MAVNSDPDAELDEVRAWMERHRFTEWLGLTVEHLDRSQVILSMKIAPHMRYVQGLLHGGLTCVLLDTAIGVAARLQVPQSSAVRTRTLETRYVSPGRGAHAQVHASAEMAGTRLVGLGTVRIDGVVVATGRAEFAIVPRGRAARDAHKAVTNPG